jgi:hypothetical protein
VTPIRWRAKTLPAPVKGGTDYLGHIDETKVQFDRTRLGSHHVEQVGYKAIRALRLGFESRQQFVAVAIAWYLSA